MYVLPRFEKKTGRTLLFYYTARRVKGKIIKTKVARIGYLDEFLDTYPDPLSHFPQEAQQKTRTVSFSLDEHFSFSSDPHRYTAPARGFFTYKSRLVPSTLYAEGRAGAARR